jgi:hypothetical protein
MITQERLKELFNYDKTTGNLVWKVDRGTNKTRGKVAGSVNGSGYISIKIENRHNLAHRLVWLWHHGYMPTHEIDHINGVRHDNRIKNLREATCAENAQNQRKAQSHNGSGYLGVHRHKGGWESTIVINKQKIYIGLFQTPEAAHAAYLAKKRELHPFQTIA